MKGSCFDALSEVPVEVDDEWGGGGHELQMHCQNGMNEGESVVISNGEGMRGPYEEVGSRSPRLLEISVDEALVVTLLRAKAVALFLARETLSRQMWSGGSEAEAAREVKVSQIPHGLQGGQLRVGVVPRPFRPWLVMTPTLTDEHRYLDISAWELADGQTEPK